MNTIKLNTIGTPCKAGGGGNSGGGGGNTPSSGWTGHADAEGLKAIGWTDEDIAYYQEHGVNWNAEDDEYHKVSEDNKALYGALTADNIATYKDRIVYLPKIDTSAKTSMNNAFKSCTALVAIPMLDTGRVIDMSYMFYTCYSLISVPLLDTGNVTTMNNMFTNCKSLVRVPHFNTANVTDMGYMFQNCSSLVHIPPLDTSQVTTMTYMFGTCESINSLPLVDTRKVTNFSYMFRSCSGLRSLHLDLRNATSISGMFGYCYSLDKVYLKNIRVEVPLNNAALLSKESLLYIINNETATGAITIKVNSYAYSRLASDSDIVGALANHPNISLASA